MTKIRLKLLSGECKVSANLSRTLGQHQINTSKFCLKFNTESNQKFINGILFYTQIEKKNKDLYEIFIKGPCLKSLLIMFLEFTSEEYIISLEKLYDLYLIYTKLTINYNIPLKTFLGSLSTISNLKINDNFFNSK